jgi:hypothetical protein
MPFGLRLLLGHSLGTALALGLFLFTFMAPFLPYSSYINWPASMPYFKPFAIGLGVSIWLLALGPATLIHTALQKLGLIYRIDYLAIGFSIGLLTAVPVMGYMTTAQIIGMPPPNGDVTTGFLYFRTVTWLLAFGLSGAAYGISYWLFLSPTRY